MAEQGTDVVRSTQRTQRAEGMNQDPVFGKQWGNLDSAGPGPRDMIAVRMHRFGAPPLIERVPVPEAGAAEVLVKMAATVVSHHDLTVASGAFAVRPALPYTPGLEGAGIVASLGEGVDPGAVVPGSPVRLYGGGLGATRPGTWAEYVVVPARAVLPVPSSLDPGVAAACGSVALTAWIALVDVGSMRPEECVGVTGASGAVGSLVTQLALQRGASRVVAFVRSEERAGSLPPGLVAVVGDASPEVPIDLLVDTVGGSSLSSRVGLVRQGGRVVYLGYTAGQEVCFTIPNLLARDVPLLPVNMMRRRPPEDLESRLVDQFAAGELRVATLDYDAREFSAAIAHLRNGGSGGRVVVRW